jgi:hypothetical protein
MIRSMGVVHQTLNHTVVLHNPPVPGSILRVFSNCQVTFFSPQSYSTIVPGTIVVEIITLAFLRTPFVHRNGLDLQAPDNSLALSQ